MKINVYIGVMGSGKDYLAKKECDIQLAFADALRNDIWKLLGWKPKTIEEYEEFKNYLFYNPVLGIAFSGRQLLQNYGTDIRRIEDPDHWASKLVAHLKRIKAFTVPVYKGDTPLAKSIIGISDCRFDNEVKKLIEFSEQESVKLEFKHTNFKSDRYNDKSDHESEKFAQQFLDFKGNQKKFNKLIWEKYGI